MGILSGRTEIRQQYGFCWGKNVLHLYPVFEKRAFCLTRLQESMIILGTHMPLGGLHGNLI